MNYEGKKYISCYDSPKGKFLQVTATTQIIWINGEKYVPKFCQKNVKEGMS